MPGQSSTASAEVDKRGAETPTQRNWVWVEAEVWTDRMVSALATASKGHVPPSRMPNGSHITPLGRSGTPPMREPPTGEPYAGKPPVRFGGRGGQNLPDPSPTWYVGTVEYPLLWSGASDR